MQSVGAYLGWGVEAWAVNPLQAGELLEARHCGQWWSLDHLSGGGGANGAGGAEEICKPGTSPPEVTLALDKRWVYKTLGLGYGCGWTSLILFCPFLTVCERPNLIYNLFKGLQPEWKCYCIPQAIAKHHELMFSEVDSSGFLPFTKMHSSANPPHDNFRELGPETSQNLMRKHTFLKAVC